MRNNLKNNRIQILTDLISSDADHDDELNFCLITLDGETLGSILDTHRKWCNQFPDALELVLDDQQSISRFLSQDEREELFLERNGEWRLITDQTDLIEKTELDNNSFAWNISLKKIIIRAADVRFVGVYEYDFYLRNAFTASQYIALDTLLEVYRTFFAENAVIRTA